MVYSTDSDKYEILYNTMATGVLYQDGQGVIISANPAAEKILDLKVEQMSQLFVAESCWRIIDELGAPVSVELLPSMEALNTGLPTGPKIIGLIKDHSSVWKWISCVSIPLIHPGDERPYQVYTVFEDITEQKKIAQNYEVLFNEMLDGFALHEIICDAQGMPVDYRYIAVNPAFEKITGLNANDIIGKSVLEILPNTESHWIKTYGSVALTGEPVWFEQYSGALNKHFEVKAFSPEPQKFATIFVDVTLRKKSEALLINEKNKAELANRTKDRFLANMSHEIRTPINSIMGILKLLELTEINEEQQSYLDLAQKSSGTLVALVDDILNLSRIMTGKLILKKEVFNLQMMISDAIAMISPVAGAKHLSIVLELSSELPEIVMGDALKLTQVINNIVGNSIKFTDNGKILIYVDGTYDNMHNLWTITFSVKDTGIGMSQNTIDRLFIPFEQGDLSTTKKYGGVGLGLSISQNLVQLMGGKIDAESRLGEGSTFRFSVGLQGVK